MIKKHIPNTITSLNLVTGSIAVVCALHNQLQDAALLVLLAALFDLLDGLAARLLKAYTTIGKELDSLADVVSFGVAPAMIIFQYLSNWETANGHPTLLAFSAFILPAFSAIRLAIFNTDDRQATSFIGLPTPANALLWSFGLAYTVPKMTEQLLHPAWIIPLIFLSSWLLISPIPMFSLKFNADRKTIDKRKLFSILVCLLPILFGGLAGISWSLVIYLFIATLSYIFRNIKKF
jgi:CDP-diacylglycerol---serine O-phosphatidyltransferase